ncbi:MAG: DNA-3-methyladenine glycosylase 2 family protein [Bryobacteraceae bacterium]|nr:DNA-3-methyladenine glycosylase 2 family protein [Bryobacteraceae bacterium]
MSDLRSDLIRSDHRLKFAEPYDFPSVLQFLAARAITEVEIVDNAGYRRTFWLRSGEQGAFEVAQGGEDFLQVRLWSTPATDVDEVLRRVARILGIDHDAASAVEMLRRDSLLRPLVDRRPGLRIPGVWDGFEAAVRAIAGQQVTLKAAVGIVGRLTRICGGDLSMLQETGLSRLFPLPADVVHADLFDLGIPATRSHAIRTLAEVARESDDVFLPENRNRRLSALPGIGDWTAQYVAMRAGRDADALPAADIVLRRKLAEAGAKLSAGAVTRRAEQWRPWRAFAVVHLWMSDVEVRTPQEASL